MEKVRPALIVLDITVMNAKAATLVMIYMYSTRHAISGDVTVPMDRI